MCGIVGYAGSKQAAPILLDGLSRLEYRGYDSAGLCVFSEGELKLAKSKGRLAVLRTKTENGATLPGYLGIGHTRWATHGAPSDENAHPQLSTNGSICIVHNGIIENFLPLKEFLLKQGKTFRSETDTEVIANLLEYYYEQENDLMKAVRLTLGRIEGSYALGILCADRPDSMIAVKKDSPLIFGFGEGENFIASDVPAILPYTRSVVYLNDGDMVVFTKNAAQFYDANGTPVRKAPEHIEWEAYTVGIQYLSAYTQPRLRQHGDFCPGVRHSRGICVSKRRPCNTGKRPGEANPVWGGHPYKSAQICCCLCR